MKTGRYQQGMSAPGLLALVIMLGFFAMCTIRMTPIYFEYLSVKDIVSRTAIDTETESLSTGQIRRRLETVFNTNQIKGLDARTIEIFRKKGKVHIDANYEVRLPLLWIIDAVMRFEDLHYVVGEPEPLTGDAAAERP